MPSGTTASESSGIQGDDPMAYNNRLFTISTVGESKLMNGNGMAAVGFSKAEMCRRGDEGRLIGDYTGTGTNTADEG